MFAHIDNFLLVISLFVCVCVCVFVKGVALFLQEIRLHFTTWKINGLAEITAFDNGFK
jgi:hypothetical protein